MDRYTLTAEGRARFRRMQIRANIDTPVDRKDYEILRFLYVHGSATVAEIEDRTGQTRDETDNEISTLISRGYVETLGRQQPNA